MLKEFKAYPKETYCNSNSLAQLFHAVFTKLFLLPKVIWFQLCRAESAALPISEEKAMGWITTLSGSLKADRIESQFAIVSRNATNPEGNPEGYHSHGRGRMNN